MSRLNYNILRKRLTWLLIFILIFVNPVNVEFVNTIKNLQERIYKLETTPQPFIGDWIILNPIDFEYVVDNVLDTTPGLYANELFASGNIMRIEQGGQTKDFIINGLSTVPQVRRFVLINDTNYPLTSDPIDEIKFSRIRPPLLLNNWNLTITAYDQARNPITGWSDLTGQLSVVSDMLMVYVHFVRTTMPANTTVIYFDLNVRGYPATGATLDLSNTIMNPGVTTVPILTSIGQTGDPDTYSPFLTIPTNKLDASAFNTGSIEGNITVAGTIY